MELSRTTIAASATPIGTLGGRGGSAERRRAAAAMVRTRRRLRRLPASRGGVSVGFFFASASGPGCAGLAAARPLRGAGCGDGARGAAGTTPPCDRAAARPGEIVGAAAAAPQRLAAA